MATAAVISWDETRQAVAKTSARQELPADLDRWLESVEANRPDDPPSLEALTQAVWARRQEWTGKIAAVLVAQRHGPGLHQRLMPCPHGPRLLPARPAPPRTVHTRVGEVSRTRPYFDCPDCQPGFAPLDAEVPFETAQELFTQLTGRSLSDPTIQAVAGELSQAWGVLEVSPTAAERAQGVAERAAGKTWRPSMVLAIAGALVPTRPAQAQGEATGRRRTRARRAGGQGACKEVTGVRFYLVDQERMVPMVSWSRMAGAEDGGTALKRVQDAGVIPADQVRWCVRGDGAQGIWTQVNALFPTAVPILDDDQCRAHGPNVGGLPCGDHAEQARAWGEAMMARLCWGDVDWASEGWETLPPREDQTVEEMRKLIGCLRHNAGRRHDRTARQGGSPIGSGGIEAAHKRIRHVRLQRSRAWWSVEQANHMLAWRCAIDNRTFQRVFEAYRRRALQRHEGYPL